jgi:hypothetical protein
LYLRNKNIKPASPKHSLVKSLVTVIDVWRMIPSHCTSSMTKNDDERTRLALEARCIGKIPLHYALLKTAKQLAGINPSNDDMRLWKAAESIIKKLWQRAHAEERARDYRSIGHSKGWAFLTVFRDTLPFYSQISSIILAELRVRPSNATKVLSRAVRTVEVNCPETVRQLAVQREGHAQDITTRYYCLCSSIIK